MIPAAPENAMDETGSGNIGALMTLLKRRLIQTEERLRRPMM